MKNQNSQESKNKTNKTTSKQETSKISSLKNPSKTTSAETKTIENSNSIANDKENLQTYQNKIPNKNTNENSNSNNTDCIIEDPLLSLTENYNSTIAFTFGGGNQANLKQKSQEEEFLRIIEDINYFQDESLSIFLEEQFKGDSKAKELRDQEAELEELKTSLGDLEMEVTEKTSKLDQEKKEREDLQDQIEASKAEETELDKEIELEEEKKLKIAKLLEGGEDKDESRLADYLINNFDTPTLVNICQNIEKKMKTEQFHQMNYFMMMQNMMSMMSMYNSQIPMGGLPKGGMSSFPMNNNNNNTNTNNNITNLMNNDISNNNNNYGSNENVNYHNKIGSSGGNNPTTQSNQQTKVNSNNIFPNQPLMFPFGFYPSMMPPMTMNNTLMTNNFNMGNASYDGFQKREESQNSRNKNFSNPNANNSEKSAFNLENSADDNTIVNSNKISSDPKISEVTGNNKTSK